MVYNVTMCTDEVISLLKTAYTHFLNGDEVQFSGALASAKEKLGARNDWLLGEWMIVDAIRNLRDPEALIHAYDRAIPLMKGRHSVVLDGGTSFAITQDSVLWMLLRKAGEADKTGKQFAGVISRTIELTGHGMGNLEFYNAELAYLRGNLLQARNLAYQAVYLAQSTGQYRLMVAASKLIAHIAIHFQDMNDWVFAVDTMTNVLKAHGDEHLELQRVVRVERNEMLVSLGAFDEVSDWQKEGRFSVKSGKGVFGLRYIMDDGTNVTACDYPQALFVHALYLLNTKQFARVLAVDAVQRMFGIEREFFCYQIYYCLLRGISYLNQGDRKRAAAEFDTAAELVKPDGFWLILAEFAPFSDGLILAAVQHTGGDTAAVRALAKDYKHNVERLREAVTGQDLLRVLTPREREIAQLAAQGLRNREIAERLVVTEQTVKFHLSNVYAKLSVGNRAKLAHVIQVYTENYTKV